MKNLPVLAVLLWSVSLQAGKHALITSAARSGAALQVEIESQALTDIAPRLSKLWQKILIDTLADFENPLEAHIDFSRFLLVTNSLNDLYISTDSASEEASMWTRMRYAGEILIAKYYDPSLPSKWEDRFLMMQKLYGSAIDVSIDVGEYLYKDTAFLDAFANEELLRGIDLENFLAAKRQEFDSADEVALEDSWQSLENTSPSWKAHTEGEVVFLDSLGKAERLEYAFNRAIQKITVEQDSRRH